MSRPRTPFPKRPSDVAALPVSEFSWGRDLNQSVAFDAACQMFLDDSNRALVWLIRFRALTTWRQRGDIAAWLQAQPTLAPRACEVAASFELNAEWEFDAEGFRSAVAATARR